MKVNLNKVNHFCIQEIDIKYELDNHFHLLKMGSFMAILLL